MIGRKFPIDSNVKFWIKVNETIEYFEMEHIEKNGCSYSFLVNKNSGLAESWRYTSSKSMCDKNTYIPHV